MKIKTWRRALLLSAAAPLFPAVALAQTAPPARGASAASAAPAQASSSNPSAENYTLPDIVVTARKRAESSLSVPVVMSAVSPAEIQRRAINNLDGIARIVPQLLIAPQGGSVQGGNMSIRGISGPDSNPFGDQAVSFNFDGVQIAKATVRRMANFDIDQVEVLKGPQALFFGKNSPAGVVSVKTADPTSHFEAGINVGYEFYAREKRTDGYISGPLTDTLGVRLAAYYSNMDGWLTDQTPSNNVLAPKYSREPWSRDYGIRGTLKWDPNDQFSARLKINYDQTRNSGPQNTGEFINCPFGARQTGTPAECSPGPLIVDAASGPVVGTLGGTLNEFGDGQNFQYQKQVLDSLQMDYRITDAITLTSVSGFYDVELAQCQNYEQDYTIALPSCNTLKDREISQEFRVATSFQGPLNVTAGVYYSNTKASTGSLTYLFGNGFDLLGPGFGGLNTPAIVDSYLLGQNGTAYSGYAQFLFKPIDVLEIDIGGRFSHEEKSLPYVYDGGGISEGNLGTSVLGPAQLLHLAVTKRAWNDFSPEATISYRPNSNMTYFVSYKHGFLSGGFNSSSVDFAIPNLDLSYGPETIHGVEIGAKALVLDDSLRLNAAAYTYNLQGLQVTEFTNATSTIRNAGAVSIKGVEGDFTWRAPIEGLQLHGAVAYNHGVYTSFPVAPCYNGQTPAEGCNIVNGAPVQSLNNTALVRAPTWNISGGFSYERPLTETLKWGISTDVTHSSSYLTDATSAPQSRMPSYTLVDANLHLAQVDDRWEVSVIARNLSNEFYWVASPNVPFTGSGTGTPAGVLGDRFASVSRGREVMIRTSLKFR